MAQFFLKNVEFIARRKLWELKHIGTISDYVKQFSAVMLDIRDMSKKDKVFCFVEGLKLWARTKLYEQKVQDLVYGHMLKPSKSKYEMSRACLYRKCLPMVACPNHPQPPYIYVL